MGCRWVRSCTGHSPEWRNGRRGGLKIPCSQGRVGSSPTSGTPPAVRKRGWYPVPGTGDDWCWWTGSQWEDARAPRRHRPRRPTRRRIRTLLALGAVLLVASITFIWLGYASVGQSCRAQVARGTSRTVDSCVADASAGVDFLALLGFASAVTCLTLAWRTARRRRSARRAHLHLVPLSGREHVDPRGP